MEKYIKILDANKKLIALCVGAILLFAAGFGFWSDYKARRNKEAAFALYEAQSKSRDLLGQGKIEDAAQVFSNIINKYSGTRPAYEAQLIMGDIYMDHKDFAKAAEQYAKATTQASDTFSQLLAKYNLGIAQESSQNYEQAINSYADAVKVKGADFLAPEILMAQARCYEALKQIDKAVDTYKQIQTKFSTKTFYSGAAAAFEKKLKANL